MRRYVPSGTVAVQNSIVINPAYPRYALHEKMRIDNAILNPVARRLFFADKVGFPTCSYQKPPARGMKGANVHPLGLNHARNDEPAAPRTLAL